LIYFHAGHYQEALDWFERSDALGGPRNPVMLAYRAATYALPGREQEAWSMLDLLNNHDGKFDWKGADQPVNQLSSQREAAILNSSFWLFLNVRNWPNFTVCPGTRLWRCSGDER